MQPVAIVTGAGSGIGRACALKLAQLGWSVVLAGRTRSKLEETARSLAAGCAHLIHADDLSTPQAAEDLTRCTVERFGSISALVNCAGIAPRIPIDQTTHGALRECLDVNALFPGCMILSCWSALKRAGNGSIVNISSLATTDPFTGFFAYAASKAALDSFTRSVARETGDCGIRVFTLNLGCVETPLLRSFADEAMVPKSRALPADAVAQRVADCICGLRDFDHGKCVAMTVPD